MSATSPGTGRGRGADPVRLLAVGALALGLVLATALGTVLGTVPFAAPAAADDPDVAAEPRHPVDVAVTGVQPQVLVPGEDLVLTVRLSNTGPAPVEVPRVTAHLPLRSYISRSSLDRWREAHPDDDAGRAVLTEELPEPLAPGERRTVTLRVPADAVGLPSGASSWGPRGLAVTVVDGATPERRRLGTARTFVLWYPAQEVTPTRVTVLVPLVGPAVDPHDDAWVGDLEALVEGRLGRALDATAEASGVSWVLDPWLVDVGSAPEGEMTLTSATDEPHDGATDEPDEPSPEPAELEEDAVPELPVVAGPRARAWVERLVEASVGRDVHVLPYGDADVAALSRADADDVLRSAEERAARVVAATDLPDNATTDLVLPAQPLPDLRTATAAARGTDQALVVGAGELGPPFSLTYTPSGRTTVRTEIGDVTVLVPDERLSEALVTGRVGTGTRPEPDRPGERGAGERGLAEAEARPPTPAEAAQDLAAELAVVTRERPNDGRHLLLAVPRDWSPDADVAAAQLAALDTVPWVRTEPVSTLVGTPDPGVDRGGLPDEASSSGAMPAGELRDLRETLTHRAEVAQVVPDPAALLGDVEAELLATTSVAWRARPEGRAEVVAASRAATDALARGVSVSPGSTVNLLSRTGELPLRVTNELDQPATVEVTLRPDDWHLRVTRPVTVTVEPGSAETVFVPVRAIQSADLDVAVEIRTVDGVLVDDSTVLALRVRADWEGIGTLVVVALLAVGLVVGVVRTIRRGRMGTRADPVDAGPDALSPEAADDGAAREVEHERDG